MSMITHLLYRSFTKGDITPGQVEKILEASRVNNERDQITGLLLYRSRIFLQLLEGAEADVLKCMGRIRHDPRHYDTGVVLQVRSDRRIFPTWQMGYIEESKIVRPFHSVEAVIEAMQGGGEADRGTVVKVIRNFAAVEAAI